MKKIKKFPFLIGLIASAVFGVAYAYNMPTQPGQSYVYLDEAGQVVGGASMSCDGSQVTTWGTITGRYSVVRNFADPCKYPDM